MPDYNEQLGAVAGKMAPPDAGMASGGPEMPPQAPEGGGVEQDVKMLADEAVAAIQGGDDPKQVITDLCSTLQSLVGGYGEQPQGQMPQGQPPQQV